MSSAPSPRDACLADLPALLALEAQFPGDRMHRRALRHAIVSPRARFRVVERKGVVLGDALLLLRRDSPAARLYSLIVSAQARGQGIAALLLDDAEAQARRSGRHAVRLEVRADNAAAIRLYERAGYCVFGRRPGYYDDGADALRMQKPL
ncbi:MAG: N-acetyltransferase [Lysobacteraceae bacterium]